MVLKIILLSFIETLRWRRNNKKQTYQSAQANLCTMVHLQWQPTEIATGMAKSFCKERCSGSSPFFPIFHQQRLVKIADILKMALFFKMKC
jgi:hypothetical protein